jgi:hypothetical protein
LQQKADNKAVRQKERDLLNSVSESTTEWLAEAMEAQKVQLGAGRALAVEVYARELRSHRQLILDTRNNTTLQEVERVSLVIRPMTDKGYRGYFLHLYVCFEINHTLPFEHPHYLGKPGNPMLAVLPVFESRSPNAPEITEGGYFFGEARKHGVRDVPISSAKPWHKQMTNPQYIEGSMAITRFDATDWPAARSTITEMLKEVYNRMLRFIEQGQ